MRVLRRMIVLHKYVFSIAVLITFTAMLLNLGWNTFLANLLDRLANQIEVLEQGRGFYLGNIILVGVAIMILLIITEYMSSYLAAYTCEIWAHDMRMGYAKHYLQYDMRELSCLNAGEEQSAMQNELSDISNYLNQNLFLFIKQFGTFFVTVIYLAIQNVKLAMVSVLPVLPLIAYCFYTGKVIKDYTEQYQSSRGQFNSLVDVILELFPILQVYQAYSLMNTNLNQTLLACEEANIRKEKVAAKLMSLSGVLSFLPLLCMLGFGGNMVLKGEISIGIFYIFINLSGNVSGFLQNMPNIYARFRGFVASVERLEKKMVLEE